MTIKVTCPAAMTGVQKLADMDQGTPDHPLHCDTYLLIYVSFIPKSCKKVIMCGRSREKNIILMVNPRQPFFSHCMFFCYIYGNLYHDFLYFIAVIRIRVKLGLIHKINTDLYCKLCCCLAILFNCYINSKLAIYYTNSTQ